MDYKDNERLKITIILGVSILIGIVLLVKGYKLKSQPDIHSATIKGIVTSAKCSRYNNSLNLYRVRTVNMCKLTIKYTINNKEYTKELTTLRNYYNPNQIINIRYNPNNHEDITLEDNNSIKGRNMIIMGVMVLGLGGMYWYYYQKPKTL